MKGNQKPEGQRPKGIAMSAAQKLARRVARRAQKVARERDRLRCDGEYRARVRASQRESQRRRREASKRRDWAVGELLDEVRSTVKWMDAMLVTLIDGGQVLAADMISMVSCRKQWLMEKVARVEGGRP